MTTVKVSSSSELLDALATADDIEVDGSLTGMPMITLRPGVTLRGGTLRFGAKGVWLTSDNLLEAWTVRAPVTSHGPSGIGFVNFGTLDRLDVQAPVATYGSGARGFNLYDGRLDNARFKSITTHADGAAGIQVSKDLPVLDITGDVTTNGGRGPSLVRGQQVQLDAIAVSVQPGGRIGRLSVGGSLSTHGDYVVTLDVEGTIGTLKVQQGITATGVGSDAVRLTGEVAGLGEVQVTAAHGQRIVSRMNVAAESSGQHDGAPAARPQAR